MEYLWRGDLLGYLRKSRGVFDQYHHGVGRVDHLTTYDMVLFAKQIAHGMTFLASRGVSAQTLPSCGPACVNDLQIVRRILCTAKKIQNHYSTEKWSDTSMMLNFLPFIFLFYVVYQSPFY